MKRWLPIVLLSTGCAAHYAYAFTLVDSSAGAVEDSGRAVEDKDVKAQLLADPLGLQAITLDLTNKTEQVLEVDWAHISVRATTGEPELLHPDVDLGWIAPGATASARLVPFVLPDRGSAAAAYDGAHFEVDVPATVRRERKRYRYELVAQAKRL